MEGAEAREDGAAVGPAVVDEAQPDRCAAAQRLGEGLGAAPPAEGRAVLDGVGPGRAGGGPQVVPDEAAELGGAAQEQEGDGAPGIPGEQRLVGIEDGGRTEGRDAGRFEAAEPLPDVSPRRQQPSGGGSRVGKQAVLHGQRREALGQLTGRSVRVGQRPAARERSGPLETAPGEGAGREGSRHPSAVGKAAEGDAGPIAAEVVDVLLHPVQCPEDVQQGKVSGGV